MKMYKFQFERTGKGYPALWEEGGAWTSSSSGMIVAGRNGQRKKALFVRRSGHLANNHHALIPVSIGDLLISFNCPAKLYEVGLTVKTFRIERIDWVESSLLCSKAGHAQVAPEGEEFRWKVREGRVTAAHQAAAEKGFCYHCREPHYCLLPDGF